MPHNTEVPAYQTSPGREIVPPTDGDGHSAAEVKRLRRGQAIMSMTGVAAQVGIREEIWLAPRFLHASERGNILLDMRAPRFRADTPGVKVQTFEGDDRIEVDYIEARINLRRKGWLRIDPILEQFGIDTTRLLKLPEDIFVETIAPLKSAEVWQAIAEMNDVSWSQDYCAIVPHSSAALLAVHLRTTAQKDAESVAKIARDRAFEWVAVIKEAAAAQGVSDGDV